MGKSDQVSFEYCASDANTAKSVLIYNQDGSARTIVTGELVYADLLTAKVGATGMAVDLFVDHDAGGDVDAGERVISGDYAANNGESIDFAGRPRFLGKDSCKLKVLTGSAAPVYITGIGHIKQA